MLTIRALVDLVEYNQRETPELVELYATLSAEATSPSTRCTTTSSALRLGDRLCVSRRFEQADAAGDLRAGVDHAGAARTLIALMDGLQVQWLYDRDSVDMAAEVRRYAQSLFTVDV